MDKKDGKFIRQIRIRHSDLNCSDPDPFLRYWIKLYDLAGPVRDELHPGYLAHVFVETGANCTLLVEDSLMIWQFEDWSRRS